jgi:hypothetical protein
MRNPRDSLSAYQKRGHFSHEHLLQSLREIALERLCNYTLDDLKDLARIPDKLLAQWACGRGGI